MEEKNKKIFDKNFFIAMAIAVAIAGSFVLGFYTKIWTTDPTLNEIEYVLKMIEDNYIGEFDKDKFIESAVDGTLDSFSEYYTAPEYSDVSLSKEGITKGKIGISMPSNTTECLIVSVEGNSPAERAGVTAGGIITGVRIDGDVEFTDVENRQEYMEFYNSLEEGQEAEYKITYGEEDKIFTLKRETYSMSYVWYQDNTGAYNLEGSGSNWSLKKRENLLVSHVNEGFAYLKFSSFSGSAYYQIKVALDKMKENGNKKVILDLRNNGGGYMDILEEICQLFCPGNERKLISKAIYKNGSEGKFYSDSSIYDDYDFERIAVLCNTGTASASEALIGAILDYDRKENKNIARVYVAESEYGYRTYGKGIMQTTFKYSTGSAIKITTAKIYWPVSSICIHGYGITPQTDERVTGVPKIEGMDAELLSAMAG